jgi:PAS domain S-box-containing protein
MAKQGNPNPAHKTLRKKAEARLRSGPTNLKRMSARDVQRLVHELEIHQIELEMQNEELCGAQIELAESRDRYSDLYDLAPIGYMTLNVAGKILDANLMVATMLGMDRRNLLRANVMKFIMPQSEKKWYSYRDAVISADIKQLCEIEMKRADGTPLDVRLEAISFGSGISHRFRMAIIDITDQKRSEKEREELLVRERAARHDAEAASQAKSRFLAMVSHELRTPLTPILGWSKLLTGETRESPQCVLALKSIERNAKLLAQLIGDLLDVSAMIAGKVRLQVRPVELTGIVNAAIDTVRPQAEARNIRIQTRFDADCRCSCDPKRLQQVIWNLLSNAIKFTPSGGRVTVQLQRGDSGMRIIVSDTGKGISAEFLPHIFDPFRQADTASTRKDGGLGLGLAIVRHITELHGGRVDAASAGEGKGTTFTIQLPFNAGHEGRTIAATRHPFRQPPDGAATSDYWPSLERVRILVVDDEVDTVEMLMATLEYYHAEVWTSRDVDGALEMFRQRRPDVLISDIAMPDRDGYALIAKVRALEKPTGKHVVAIALTAYVRMEDRARALNAGFDAFVAKPVEPSQLLSVLAAVRRQADENVPPSAA